MECVFMFSAISPETFILRSSRLLLRRTEVQGRADPALLKNFYSMWRGDAENNHNSLMVLEYCFFFNFQVIVLTLVHFSVTILLLYAALSSNG